MKTSIVRAYPSREEIQNRVAGLCVIELMGVMCGNRDESFSKIVNRNISKLVDELVAEKVIKILDK